VAKRNRFKREKIDEDARTKQSTSRYVQYGYGCRREYGHEVDWGLLRKFLISHIGQHWPKIYSEICESHKDWREYIKWEVEANVYKEGEAWYSSDGRKLWSGDFFVHPVSKCLLRVKGDIRVR